VKSYSQDLREKIIRTLETQEEMQSEIADRSAVLIAQLELTKKNEHDYQTRVRADQ
jgi:hypothetical protein